MSDTAKFVKGVMTVNGIGAVDYNFLGNLPTVDGAPIQGDVMDKALQKKLDANDGQAADSILFDGKAASFYATAEQVQSIEQALGLNTEGDAQISEVITNIEKDIDALEKKFNQTGQALDAEKFGGQMPDYYATKKATEDAQSVADKANDLAEKVSTALSGCWIEFTDEDGNPTDEPYVHWYVEE